MTADNDTIQRLLTFDNRSLTVLQELAALFGEMQRAMRDLASRNHELELLATTDSLTGLANRRGFEDDLGREEARARREHGSAAVVALDVRKLKTVNDSYGHGVGDDLLRAVGFALRGCARKSDVVARLGGDEFAALLPGASRAGGEIFVERVRSSVRSLLLPAGTIVSVQLSAGVAVREEADSLQEAYQLADGRLLLDKQRASA
ncbi:MAG: GGDEF domain-containing protein [Dehalococcoidia bacterium]